MVVQFLRDPAGAVGTPGTGVDVPDPAGQVLFHVGLLLPCVLVSVPGVVAGAVPSQNVALGIAERNRQPISFWQFTKYGLIVTAATVAISLGYVWLRYFALA
ncbi:hypothetical protein AB0D27_07450 [Streptomyces sp. NPDC048415]|uniref:hypothetical protein n=1 Tax=Streptomyces sp. NPDC048415 TaxID=3154822 RepID=UPI003423DCAA